MEVDRELSDMSVGIPMGVFRLVSNRWETATKSFQSSLRIEWVRLIKVDSFELSLFLARDNHNEPKGLTCGSSNLLDTIGIIFHRDPR